MTFKYIAWLNSTSVAAGDNIADIRQKALDIFNSPRYRRFGDRIVTLRITTYGAQRPISSEQLEHTFDDGFEASHAKGYDANEDYLK